MSVDENKRRALQFFEYFSRQAVDSAFAMLAPDAMWWVPTDQPGGMFLDKATIRMGVGAFFGVFAEFPVFQVQRVTAEGDRVCVEQTARNGRTKGGAEYANDYHMLVQFRDGLIVEVREYMNPLLAGAVTAEMNAASH